MDDAVAPPAPSAVAPRPRILLCDDDTGVAASMQACLGDVFDFCYTPDPHAVPALVAAAQPHALLLDVHMPALGGVALCQQLRQSGAVDLAPIIFITASLDDGIELAGFAAGAVDFLRKPVHPRIAQARIERHLEHAALAQALRLQAEVDPLTGLGNRRAFDRLMDQHVRQAQRDDSEVALLVADIDHFKQYNDALGHAAGDACLRAVAREVRGAMRRPYDMAARIGGEEFACLLPRTDRAGALASAERLRSMVGALALPHPGLASRTVSISVGTATARSGSDGPFETLFVRADRALYDAKHAGRDCVR